MADLNTNIEHIVYNRGRIEGRHAYRLSLDPKHEMPQEDQDYLRTSIPVLEQHRKDREQQLATAQEQLATTKNLLEAAQAANRMLDDERQQMKEREAKYREALEVAEKELRVAASMDPMIGWFRDTHEMVKVALAMTAMEPSHE